MPRAGRDAPAPQPIQPPTVVADKRLALRAARTGRADVPVRTVVYIEVGDLAPSEVRKIAEHVKTIHGDPFHPTFIVPVRHGKMVTDVAFEAEIMSMVNKICEVKDGQIVLREGARDVEIMRTNV